ncbi:MAG: TIGR04282 family arsenosugar biosynthesis glycosyltransferase [Desulfuromonadaceae bacterium]|nr:TIGR04282 family arsenosugar biosynthesis glycosyltransferase [Desulfuromonadaceae bacterium]
MTDAVLGIFAKPPAAGKVKTRLCPPLTGAEAAAFYQTALHETINVFSTLGIDLVLFHSGTGDYFRQHFPHLQLRPQAEGDLGTRLEQALRDLLADGYQRAALIGSDSPDLPPKLVDAAFSALREHACVTIPAGDGGYVLIGESQHHPELFAGIPWSTTEVFAATQRRAAAFNLSCATVGQWEDCDDWGSVLALLERSPRSATAQYVRDNLARYL